MCINENKMLQHKNQSDDKNEKDLFLFLSLRVAGEHAVPGTVIYSSHHVQNSKHQTSPTAYNELKILRIPSQRPTVFTL